MDRRHSLTHFTSTQLQPRCAKRQLSYYRLWNRKFILKVPDLPHLLTNIVRSHIADNCSNHLKVYTNGSLLENGYSGAGFVIPHFKTGKDFHIAQGYSIFTAELRAVLTALSYLSGVYMYVLCAIY